MQTTTDKQTINGLDTEALHSLIGTVNAKRELGKYQFRTQNRWIDADQNETTIQDFYGNGGEDTSRVTPFKVQNGEPRVFLGKDLAPNPAEFLLHALAGCLSTTTISHAAARGIEIESLESEIEADMDVAGFFGLDPAVRTGAQGIRVNLKIKTSGDKNVVRDLHQFSPILDSVRNPVPVTVNVTFE